MDSLIYSLANSPFDYDGMRHALAGCFQRAGFERLVIEGQTHSKQRPIYRCASGAQISLDYPGRNAGFNRFNRYRFDYRVKFQSSGEARVLSHVEIVLEIVWKLVDGVLHPSDMQRILSGVSVGHLASEPADRELRPPPLGLVQIAQQAYARMKKPVPKSIVPQDLSLEELTANMFWILLQEDVNYPRERGLEGRQMGLDRYAEAVWASRDIDSRLALVLERTLTERSKPKRLEDCDYSFVDLAPASGRPVAAAAVPNRLNIEDVHGKV